VKPSGHDVQPLLQHDSLPDVHPEVLEVGGELQPTVRPTEEAEEYVEWFCEMCHQDCCQCCEHGIDGSDCSVCNAPKEKP
jgi:hypothetical protein